MNRNGALRYKPMIDVIRVKSLVGGADMKASTFDSARNCFAHSVIAPGLLYSISLVVTPPEEQKIISTPNAFSFATSLAL